MGFKKGGFKGNDQIGQENCPRCIHIGFFLQEELTFILVVLILLICIAF